MIEILKDVVVNGQPGAFATDTAANTAEMKDILRKLLVLMGGSPTA